LFWFCPGGFANMQRFTIGTTEIGGYPALSAQ